MWIVSPYCVCGTFPTRSPLRNSQDAANRKKRKTRGKSITPGALILNVPGSRRGGIPLRAAADPVAPMKERMPSFPRKAPEENHIIIRIIKAHVDRAPWPLCRGFYDFCPKGQDLFIFPVNIIHRKCQADILAPVVYDGKEDHER